MPKWTDKVQREDFEAIVNAALPPIGLLLQGESMMRCPVRTGRLRESITWATNREKSGDNVSRPTDRYTLHVGTNVEYSQHVEYGTRFSGAQPYLRPAMDAGKRNAQKMFTAEMKRHLRGK